MGGVNQSLNSVRQKGQTELNFRNNYYDEKLNEVSISSVQQVNDQAYYNRGSRWVDSRLVGSRGAGQARQESSSSARKNTSNLAHRLARENRQGSIALTRRHPADGRW